VQAQSLVTDLAAATLSVAPDALDDSARVYREIFGYDVEWDGSVDGVLWGLAPRERRMLVLGAPGESRGLLRLVEGTTPAPPPLGTYGWSALEITVRDVDALPAALSNSGRFRINGEPKDLRFSTGPPGQRAMQAVGPAGEQLYLTQILRQTPGRELAVPPPGVSTGAIFIAVLATRDYRAARSFYVDLLGMDAYIEVDQAYLSVAARESGWPSDVRCTLAALKPRGETRIELDGYPPPPLARLRAREPGELPPGFGLASFYVTDLDRALAAAGVPRLSERVCRAEPPYHGRRAATLRGGDGELVELIGLEDA
jgi:catechol 2,3-dioxygenase-like lactoylglutathione lyase family enzyme